MGGVLRDGTTGQFTTNPHPVPEKRSCIKHETYVEHYYHTGLSQSVGLDANRMATCLERLPFTFGITNKPAEGSRKALHRWGCASKPLYETLAPLGKAPDKHIPREFLGLSRRQSMILLKALMLGDGSDQGSWTYYTSSRQLADDVQELALRCGLAADIGVTDRTDQEGYNNPEYVVGIKRVRVRPEARHTPSLKPYRGQVHCVTVPNGLLYVRRGGQAVWCGNSGWGHGGFYYLAPEVVADMEKSHDFWTIFGGWERYKKKA